MYRRSGGLGAADDGSAAGALAGSLILREPGQPITLTSDQLDAIAGKLGPPSPTLPGFLDFLGSPNFATGALLVTAGIAGLLMLFALIGGRR